jgi:hypothetical protein
MIIGEAAKKQPPFFGRRPAGRQVFMMIMIYAEIILINLNHHKNLRPIFKQWKRFGNFKKLALSLLQFFTSREIGTLIKKGRG